MISQVIPDTIRLILIESGGLMEYSKFRQMFLVGTLIKGEASLALSLVMTPVHAGSGSHLAVPGSDLSNLTELAKHHSPKSAQKERRGRRRRVRKRSG
eukprot:superscaffoldBa00001421_g10458